jgi:hypothetical protein
MSFESKRTADGLSPNANSSSSFLDCSISSALATKIRGADSGSPLLHLEVAEGGLENTAGGAGAAENLVDEASNGDEVSKLGSSAALDESRS